MIEYTDDEVLRRLILLLPELERIRGEAEKQKCDLLVLYTSQALGVPFMDVTRHQRNLAKSVTFGARYGMGSGKLRDCLTPHKEETGMKRFRLRTELTVTRWIEFEAESREAALEAAESINRQEKTLLVTRMDESDHHNVAFLDSLEEKLA